MKKKVLVKAYVCEGNTETEVGEAIFDYEELLAWHWSHKERPECTYTTLDSEKSGIGWTGDFTVAVIRDMVTSL